MDCPVLWIHAEALGPANPALLAHPGRPALFVFDDKALHRTEEKQFFGIA